MAGLKPTSDPHVFIEASRRGYVRYYRDTDGRRWEVHGQCDRRGDCLIGVVVANERGEPEVIRDHAHVEELKARLGVERIGSIMDQPVTPEFDECCGNPTNGKLTYTELEPAATSD